MLKIIALMVHGETKDSSREYNGSINAHMLYQWDLHPFQSKRLDPMVLVKLIPKVGENHAHESIH